MGPPAAKSSNFGHSAVTSVWNPDTANQVRTWSYSPATTTRYHDSDAASDNSPSERSFSDDEEPNLPFSLEMTRSLEAQQGPSYHPQGSPPLVSGRPPMDPQLASREDPATPSSLSRASNPLKRAVPSQPTDIPSKRRAPTLPVIAFSKEAHLSPTSTRMLIAQDPPVPLAPWTMPDRSSGPSLMATGASFVDGRLSFGIQSPPKQLHTQSPTTDDLSSHGSGSISSLATLDCPKRDTISHRRDLNTRASVLSNYVEPVSRPPPEFDVAGSSRASTNGVLNLRKGAGRINARALCVTRRLESSTISNPAAVGAASRARDRVTTPILAIVPAAILSLAMVTLNRDAVSDRRREERKGKSKVYV